MSDIFNFIASVLPVEGYPVITHRSIDDEGKGWWKNNAFTDIRSAAGWAKWLESKGVDVYFACATYRDVEVIEGKTNRFKVDRTQSNAHSIGAFWADLDIKPEGNHHRTGKDALLALAAACKSLGIPFPMVVKSGRGLHLYWLLSQAVAPAVWKPVALALERALLAHDVLIDKGVTPDTARILRPVGTMWKKEQPHREVAIYRGMDDDDRHSAAWYLNRLADHTDPTDATRFFTDTDDEFMGGMYPAEDIDAEVVASKCNQLKLFKDSEGNVEEPLWYATLGLLKFCADGEDVAQAWSEGHPDYDPAITTSKMAQWNVGPTTCARFKELNSEGCAGCIHADKVKTPLRLGRTGAVSEPEQKHPSDRIPGYEWCPSSERMVAIRKGDDGQTQREPFCKTRYWVHNYILANGTAELVLHSQHERFERKDDIEEHTIDLSTVGGGGRELHAKLAGYMLTDTSGNRQLARSYLLDYQEYLKRSVREIQTYRQFGWINHNEFLMGDRVVTPTDDFEVRLGGQAASKTGVFEADKPAEEWVRVVNDVYNRKNGEPYQAVICASLGSALVPLLGLEEFSGIPVAVTSDESGYGKTTVCCVAMAAWGAVRRGLNVLSGDEASLISMEWQLSIFNNMPGLYDEQTHRDGQFTSGMLYMQSNGTARARGTPDGKLREMAPSWKGTNFITGNRNILSKLCESKANPEAAQMRVFEISLDTYPKLDTLRDAQALSQKLNEVRSGFGVIGVAFVRYVMANRGEVVQMLRDAPGQYFAGMHHDKERFYVNSATCSLVAGKILRKLGYVEFNIEHLALWMKNHILQLRGNVEELRNTAEDNLSRCLTALCQRLLVTDYMERADQDPVIPLRGDIAGRVATVDRRCYVTLQAINEWCMKSGIQWTRFRASLANEGLLSPEMVDINSGLNQPSIRINLGKGVKGYTTGMSRVVAFNYDRLARTLSEITIPDNVVPMRGTHNEGAEAADLRGPGRGSESAH
jgi:hypothetical protein